MADSPVSVTPTAPTTPTNNTTSEAPAKLALDAQGNPYVSPDAKAAQALEAAKAKTPVKAEAPKREIPASQKKKYSLKVDGKNEDMEIDLSNEEEMIKHLQLSKASQKRMQESAEMRKGLQELFQALQTDPARVLNDPRLNIPEEVKKKLAEAIVNKELQEMQKSPEQKEKERLQAEYERLKQQVEEEKKGREAAEFARLQEHHAVQLDNDISEAITASGLPKSWVIAA